jgi:hypothetical protein
MLTGVCLPAAPAVASRGVVRERERERERRQAGMYVREGRERWRGELDVDRGDVKERSRHARSERERDERERD